MYYTNSSFVVSFTCWWFEQACAKVFMNSKTQQNLHLLGCRDLIGGIQLLNKTDGIVLCRVRSPAVHLVFILTRSSSPQYHILSKYRYQWLKITGGNWKCWVSQTRHALLIFLEACLLLLFLLDSKHPSFSLWEIPPATSTPKLHAPWENLSYKASWFRKTHAPAWRLVRKANCPGACWKFPSSRQGTASLRATG